MGFIFTGILEDVQQVAAGALARACFFLSSFWLPVLFMVPLLTMKCLAEERRLGTIETLLTTPVTTTEVVLGKYRRGLLALHGAVGLDRRVLLHSRNDFPAIARFLDSGPLARRLSLHRGLRLVLRRDRRFRELAFPQPVGRRHPRAASCSSRSSSADAISELPWLDRGVLRPIKAAVDYARCVRHHDDFTRGVVDTRHLLFYLSGTVLALIFSILGVEAKLLHS